MNRDKFILGLHIDDDFLNIVHLGQSDDGLQVHNWTAEPLEEGVVKDGLITDTQVISEKIRNFIKTNQLKSCKAVMSLPFSVVRLKPSEFPEQPDESLRKQVEDQVGKYVLFGGERIVFDYCILEDATQSSNKLTVLEAVTTRQISDACLVVAKKAKLDLVRIEPAVLPIIKLVFDKQAADSEAISLLLVLDSASGNLSVFKNGLTQLCQNLSIGTRALSQDKDALTHLTDQMKPVLEFAYSLASSQKLILRVAAACNNEELRAIICQIEQSLSNVTVEQIDQSQIAKQFDVHGTEGRQVSIFALSSALTALGVCESQEMLNLLSQESLIVQRTQKEMSLTAKAIVAVILLSIAALVPLKMKIRSVKATSAKIEAKLTQTIPTRQKIIDLKRQIKQLNKERSAYDAASKRLTDIPWPKALKVIADTAPDKVRVVDISTTDSGDFTLLGEALTENYVYRFAKKLQDDELIESAKVEEIEYDDSNTRRIIDYKIVGKIQLPQSEL